MKYLILICLLLFSGCMPPTQMPTANVAKFQYEKDLEYPNVRAIWLANGKPALVTYCLDEIVCNNVAGDICMSDEFIINSKLDRGTLVVEDSKSTANDLAGISIAHSTANTTPISSSYIVFECKNVNSFKRFQFIIDDIDKKNKLARKLIDDKNLKIENDKNDLFKNNNYHVVNGKCFALNNSFIQLNNSNCTLSDGKIIKTNDVETVKNTVNTQ